MFYGVIILFSMFLIGLFNCLFNTAYGTWYLIVAVALCTVTVIAVDGLFAAAVRWVMPSKWFHKDKNFSAGKKECRFYEKLGIKKWKDKVLELGIFANFRKNKIAEPANNEYIARYILEAHYGIVVHIFCIIFGFCVMGIFYKNALSIALPVAVINAVLNFLPVMILRYNLPKLKALYKFNENRGKAHESAKTISS